MKKIILFLVCLLLGVNAAYCEAQEQKNNTCHSY